MFLAIFLILVLLFTAVKSQALANQTGWVIEQQMSAAQCGGSVVLEKYIPFGKCYAWRSSSIMSKSYTKMVGDVAEVKIYDFKKNCAYPADTTYTDVSSGDCLVQTKMTFVENRPKCPKGASCTSYHTDASCSDQEMYGVVVIPNTACTPGDCAANSQISGDYVKWICYGDDDSAFFIGIKVLFIVFVCFMLI